MGGGRENRWGGREEIRCKFPSSRERCRQRRGAVQRPRGRRRALLREPRGGIRRRLVTLRAPLRFPRRAHLAETKKGLAFGSLLGSSFFSPRNAFSSGNNSCSQGKMQFSDLKIHFLVAKNTLIEFSRPSMLGLFRFPLSTRFERW